MKPAALVACGMAAGLLGGALMLVTAPRVDLPCQVTVTYSKKVFKPAKPGAQFGRVVNIQKESVLRGTGRFGPASLSCEVDLQKVEAI